MRRLLAISVFVVLSVSGMMATCVITTAPTLASGTLGTPYSTFLAQAGCGSSISVAWTKLSGSLPPGVNLHPNLPTLGDEGVAGTPTSAGTYLFTMQAAGSLGTSAPVTFSITITVGSPSFLTSSIPSATKGHTYSATLVATGGTGSYTFSLAPGSALPTPLTLSSSGLISGGAPTTVGYYSLTASVCDTQPLCVTRQFFIGVFPPLDTYQGIIGITPSWCTPNGYFQVGKESSNRWDFCDPSGNAFYLLGVHRSTYTNITLSVLNSRYCGGSCISPQWFNHTTSRIQSWGFNAYGPFTVNDYWNGSAGVNLYPFLPLVRPAAFAYTYPSQSSPPPHYCTGYPGVIVKDIDTLLPSSVTSAIGYSELMLDDFDPAYVACSQDAATNAYDTTGTTYQPGYINKTDPRVVGVAMDESDEYAWLGATGGIYPNIGYLIAVSNFCGTNGSANVSTIGCTSGTSSVQPNFTKFAWACLQGTTINIGFGAGVSYLEHTYGTIGALKTAWGISSYTAFCSTGNSSGSGYVSGTGVIDDNGRFMGSTSDPINLTGLNGNATTIKADFENFIRIYAKQMFYPAIHYIKTTIGDTHHLMFSMDFLGGHAGSVPDHRCSQAPDPNSVLGMSDAGVDVFFGCSMTSGTMTSIAVGIYNTTGKPVVVWTASSANADSFWHGQTSNTDDYPAQHTRGASDYAAIATAVFGATAGDGSFPLAGITPWGVTDDNSSEHTNFGFISNNDNSYDGNGAIAAVGKDAQGYATGGEAFNYTNFDGYVTQANLGIISQFLIPTGNPPTVNNTILNNVIVH